MNPKHTSLNLPREKDGKQFYARAPYNFVPLPEQVVTVGEPPDHDHYEGNAGYIECELETKSPLYVRGMMTQMTFEAIGDKSFHELNDEQKQERAQFFILRDNEPVIPGSSLRGMIRALVEIVGYGKVAPVNNTDRFFYRAVAAPKDDPLGKMYREQMGKVQAGYLVKQGNDWFIHPAKKLGTESFVKAKEKFIPHELPFVRLREPNYKPQYVPVSFTVKTTPNGRLVADKVGKLKQYAENGVMVCSGNMMESSGDARKSRRENHCVVAAPATNADLIRINPDAVNDYISALSEFQKAAPFDERMGCLIEGRPIFYLLDGSEITRFGHTPNFRLPFLRKGGKRANSPLDFVPARLCDERDLDLVEAIFGYTKSDDLLYGKQRAYASRVFVSDAIPDVRQEHVWLTDREMIVPKILSSPKPTTFQHYLVQDDDAAQNKRDLKHLASSLDETVIRGHKLYWHKGDISCQDIEVETDKIEKAKSQLTGINPVRAGVAFKFRVYFENLSDAELGALLWVLGLPDGNCQALGMGKPLGMGAVKITPALYLSDRNLRYTCLFENDKWVDGIHQETDRERFTRAFENFVLERMDANERAGKQKLAEVERIQMLLKMLEFPGPDRDWTRYMTIEPNEFKERPVLPDPLHIVPTSDGAAKLTSKPSVSPIGRATKPPASQQSLAPKTPSSPAKKRQAAPPQSVAPASPYKVGDTLNGTVRQIWKDGTFIIEAPKLTYPNGYACVAKVDAAGKGWKDGGAARCEVVRIDQDQKGRVVLYCKPGAKQEKKK